MDLLGTSIFFIGLIIGSFLNVCIYRIPVGKSIIWPPSTCICNERIPFYFNIPVLGWLILRGRTDCCKNELSFRYPLVELLTGILFLLCFLEKDLSVAIIGMVFISILIAATFIDLDHLIIPNVFSVGGLFIGLIVSFIIPEIHGLYGDSILNHFNAFFISLMGICVGTTIVYWISVLAELILKKPAMGEGDIKFLACIGAFLGWQGALFSIFGGAVIGLFLLIPIILIKNIRREKLGEIPFGPFLSIGAITYFLFLEEFVNQYFERIMNIL